MISNIINKNSIRIIAYLAISPGSKYTRKDLKEKTQMNNIPLDETLNKLVYLRLIKKEKKLYSLNLESEKTKQIIEIIKKEYDKFSLNYKVFIIVLEISEQLCKIKEIDQVILFGSYAKLIHTEKSDIDIAIIISSGKIENKTKNKIRKSIEKITNATNKIIETHIFTSKELKENTADPLIKDILKNGKSLT